MSWSNFKYVLLVLLSTPLCLFGATDDNELPAPKRWDKRVHLRYEGWERLKPTHVKMQYAGGMGVMSAGVGWDYGKRRQWETDFLIGYLPPKYATDLLFTLTVKQNYIPWSMSFDEHILLPLREKNSGKRNPDVTPIATITSVRKYVHIFSSDNV